MIRMYASNSHSYTHLILALGIVREPTVWGFITSKYPGIHDIGLPPCHRCPESSVSPDGLRCRLCSAGRGGVHGSSTCERCPPNQFSGDFSNCRCIAAPRADTLVLLASESCS